ncbi:MAG: amino acid ABC transporter substrate-binding protein [Planctomycetales bacterium]|nr:amino acid ABC transporter substrate-binding protein [Planctomycetales bacterium]
MKQNYAKCVAICVVLLTATAAWAQSLQDAVARGSVRIGVSQFIPWTFANRDGQLEGFEIDVGRQVADEMGVEADFKVYEWDDIIGGIERGEIDFIAAGLAITPGRALRVEYSLPYTESGAALIVNKRLLPDAKNIDALNTKGVVVVAVGETASAELAPLFFDEAEIKTFTDGFAAEEEILNDRAQVYLTSVPEADVLLRRYGDVVALLDKDPLPAWVAAFAVRPGNQSLLNFLNAWVTARKADGWLEKTYDYWFGGDIWETDAKP